MERTYLGDAVYADITRGMIRLTTENGDPHHPTNEIFLEPAVYAALAAFAGRAQAAARAPGALPPSAQVTALALLAAAADVEAATDEQDRAHPALLTWTARDALSAAAAGMLAAGWRLS